MVKRFGVAALFLWFLLAITHTKTTENLFYITPAPDGLFTAVQLQHLEKHANALDIIAPQVFTLNARGDVNGSLDPHLLAIAQKKHLKVMPLITNVDFDQSLFHDFLSNPEREGEAIQRLLALCKVNQLYGIQFDFENIAKEDRDKLTHFFQSTADTFHQQGLAISIAVVPRDPSHARTDHADTSLDTWSGAYNYQALGKASDFVSMMTYDQHTTLTEPGPIAAYNWVEQSIKLLLNDVPSKKLSLGIPTYSGCWAEDNHGSKRTALSFTKVQQLIETHQLSLKWHRQWKVPYTHFKLDGNNASLYSLYVENSSAFRAKKALAKKYRLRGISVWKFGLEDPSIW